MELNNLIGFTLCHELKKIFTNFSEALKALKSGLLYHVYRNQGQGPITHGVKFFNRLYVAMLACPTVLLSGRHELKIFQQYGYFSSDSSAADYSQIF